METKYVLLDTHEAGQRVFVRITVDEGAEPKATAYGESRGALSNAIAYLDRHTQPVVESENGSHSESK